MESNGDGVVVVVEVEVDGDDGDDDDDVDGELDRSPLVACERQDLDRRQGVAVVENDLALLLATAKGEPWRATGATAPLREGTNEEDDEDEIGGIVMFFRSEQSDVFFSRETNQELTLDRLDFDAGESEKMRHSVSCLRTTKAKLREFFFKVGAKRLFLRFPLKRRKVRRRGFVSFRSF